MSEDHHPHLNLASERLGAKVVYVTDEFFAPAENLLKPGRGIFIEDKYTDRGKWMDGWESRRKRTEGHDYCIIQLGAPGVVREVVIDTNHFLGNHPPHASLEACLVEGKVEPIMLKVDEIWKELLSKSPLQPGTEHRFEIDNESKFTHLRFHIYPDGGVARLKAFGEVQLDWSKVDASQKLDLAAAVHGARAIQCNDMFFSSMNNLLMPGRGINMGDGWETKRNRDPGNCDWTIIRLAHRGTVDSVLIDTCHFKGNYPDSCTIEGLDAAADDESSIAASTAWKEILPKSRLSAHSEHPYNKGLKNRGPFTHVRLKIFPDGGVSRLRIFGKPTF